MDRREMTAATTKRVSLERDEWWPVFSVEDAEGNVDDLDLPTDLIERYKQASVEFRAVQRLLKEEYENARA